MRALITRFVPRASLPPAKVVPPPLTKKQEKAMKEPLVKIMQRRQEEAGKSWPMNLRIEPILARRATGSFPKAVRSKMRKLLTER
ncbi:hypothetical protein F5J12DRAFT_480483 [Pisolithus orientalis]|uniref:uncharacterized protein n=1 Tax=Pisolithus orientalis TaxID=936130 RepID=UPI00222404C4|nr:uncharacterized protein F5J12DRAFT_480483 [Pisolithus orientalis]KAI6019638.1 hypothetical protein F5J12DRAFT_480483 [Pisolithus orientalis]